MAKRLEKAVESKSKWSDAGLRMRVAVRSKMVRCWVVVSVYELLRWLSGWRGLWKVD